MYQIIARFDYRDFKSDPVTLINQVVNQWRYNGQIIGQEFAVTYQPNQADAQFHVRLSSPEQSSLLPENNSDEVNKALAEAEKQGVSFDLFEVVGRDFQAEPTCETRQSAFQILYTTYLDSCSPVYDGEEFAPIPLYRATGKNPSLGEKLIKWQEDWQACDQLQMNGSVLETDALNQISRHDSELSRQGIALCRALEKITQVPTFYYLYRLGSDRRAESERKCPNCGGMWKLAEPLHQFLYFKCDRCRLVSNLSWEILD